MKQNFFGGAAERKRKEMNNAALHNPSRSALRKSNETDGSQAKCCQMVIPNKR